MFEVVFLGTSASAPSIRRGLPSAIVMHKEYRFMVDCGEGTQRQLLRSGHSCGTRTDNRDFLAGTLRRELCLDPAFGEGAFGLMREAPEEDRVSGYPSNASRLCLPVNPGVAFGNPSVLFRNDGDTAREALEEARGQVAAFVGADPSEIVFTSGATEANNLAMIGAARALVERGRHLVTQTTEHPSVLEVLRALGDDGESPGRPQPDGTGR